MKKRKSVLNLLFLIIFTFIFSACGNDAVLNNESDKEENNIGVERDNQLLQYFIEIHPDNEVILCGQEDVNNDDTKDLVIIYKVSKNKNAMKVVINKQGKYECTKEVSAPVENQTIKFKNIDEKEQIEFIVSGSKNGQIGYGIFRLENMEIINLFGQGMEDCC